MPAPAIQRTDRSQRTDRNDRARPNLDHAGSRTPDLADLTPPARRSSQTVSPRLLSASTRRSLWGTGCRSGSDGSSKRSTRGGRTTGQLRRSTDRHDVRPYRALSLATAVLMTCRLVDYREARRRWRRVDGGRMEPPDGENRPRRRRDSPNRASSRWAAGMRTSEIMKSSQDAAARVGAPAILDDPPRHLRTASP